MIGAGSNGSIRRNVRVARREINVPVERLRNGSSLILGLAGRVEDMYVDQAGQILKRRVVLNRMGGE